jgi:hypothetical protein
MRNMVEGARGLDANKSTLATLPRPATSPPPPAGEVAREARR